MKDQVTAAFDRSLRRTFETKPEILAFLHRHERKGVCIERLCEQIQAAENAANIGGRFDVRRFEMFIDTTAMMFANAALTYAEEKAISSAEATRRQIERDKIERAQEIMNEMEKEARDLSVKSFPTVPHVPPVGVQGREVTPAVVGDDQC